MPSITSMPLHKMVQAIARQMDHEGGVLITKSFDGEYHIGVSGLTDQEIQNAFCIGIHHNFNKMDELEEQA